MLENFFLLSTPLNSTETGTYIPFLVVLSYLVTSLASYVALDFAGHLRRQDLSIHKNFILMGGAFALGAGICAIHYTGMEAAVFIPFANCRYAPDQTFDLMALSITAVTSLIFGGALTFSAFLGQQKSTKDISYKEDLNSNVNQKEKHNAS